MAERSTITRFAAGQPVWLRAVRAVVSPTRPRFAGQRLRFLAALVLRVAGAGLLVWIGYIHWTLWQEGYKYIHIDGPFFLVDAIAAYVLAAALLVLGRPLVGLLAAGFTLSTIAALVISLRVGLFGFSESIHASYVVESLWLESITTGILAIWTAIAAAAVASAKRR